MKSLGGLRNQGRLSEKKRRWPLQEPGGKKGMTTEGASLAGSDWGPFGETSGTYYYTFLSDHGCSLQPQGNPEIVPNSSTILGSRQVRETTAKMENCA